jgi:uncharacterized metal-binding protein
VDHQEDVVMVPSMDYTREHVKICFNSNIYLSELYLHVGNLSEVANIRKRKVFKSIMAQHSCLYLSEFSILA